MKYNKLILTSSDILMQEVVCQQLVFSFPLTIKCPLKYEERDNCRKENHDIITGLI